jgi:LPXTG-site transpeptidase (sortase) family protein
MNRRTFTAGAGMAALLVSVRPMGMAARDEEPIDGPSAVPSTGARRPGPIMPAATPGGESAARDESPVAIRIPNAAVDASVERLDIADGVMPNPSGPWVVSWYHDLATLGRGHNVVMAGHVDYWDVGPAVFWNLAQLVPGDEIEVLAENDKGFNYAVAWIKNYIVADMTPDDFDEMLGDVGSEALTLITCAIGSWDEATQEYRERMVLRALHI